MSVARGFLAGMQTSGRFGAIGGALKNILASLQQQGQIQSDTNLQMMKGSQAMGLQMMDDASMMTRQRMNEEGAMARIKYAQDEANKRAMIAEGYVPNDMGGFDADQTPLPSEMSDAGYVLYKGKPYKTRSIVDDIPGEREAMEFAYLNYIYENLKKTDPALASEVKTQMESRKRLRAASMLDMDPNAVGSPGEQNWWDRMKGAGRAMLDFVKD